MNQCRQAAFLQHFPLSTLRRPRVFSNSQCMVPNWNTCVRSATTRMATTQTEGLSPNQQPSSASNTFEETQTIKISKEKPEPKAVPRGDKLVMVGLGNPGSSFKRTRHNIGFALLEAFAARNRAGKFQADRRLQADIAKFSYGGKEVTLVKPRTFMNASGKAVRAVLKQLNAPLSAVMVVVDDISLDIGRVRLRASGSAGGHNGLKSIQNSLASQEYARLKVGVGKPPGGAQQWSEHVLGKFSGTEQKALEEVEWDVMEILEYWADEEDFRKVIAKVGELGNAKAKR